MGKREAVDKSTPKCPGGCTAPLRPLISTDTADRYQCGNVDCLREFSVTKHWNEPHKWDIEAKRERIRRRVFCASMADVFEAREDLDAQRDRLWRLIDDTTGLDWLLLTKRPENILAMIPPAWQKAPRPNVWFGTTAEDQEWADKRIEKLALVPARVRFLSVEPLLGPLDLSVHFRTALLQETGKIDDRGIHMVCTEAAPLIHWVIVGGESGGLARPFDVNAARLIIGQCRDAKVAVFMKQLGAMPTLPRTLKDRKGGEMSEWPADLRIREFPGVDGMTTDPHTCDNGPRK